MWLKASKCKQTQANSKRMQAMGSKCKQRRATLGLINFNSVRERAFRRACLWVCCFVVRRCVRLGVCDQIMSEKTHLRTSIPNLTNNVAKWRKCMQNGAKSVQNRAKKRPKGAKMDPKGSKMGQNGSKMSSKFRCSKKVGSRTAPGVRGYSLLEPFWPKRSPRDRFWMPFWSHFPSKIISKIDPEIES